MKNLIGITITLFSILTFSGCMQNASNEEIIAELTEEITSRRSYYKQAVDSAFKLILEEGICSIGFNSTNDLAFNIEKIRFDYRDSSESFNSLSISENEINSVPFGHLELIYFLIDFMKQNEIVEITVGKSELVSFSFSKWCCPPVKLSFKKGGNSRSEIEDLQSIIENNNLEGDLLYEIDSNWLVLRILDRPL